MLSPLYTITQRQNIPHLLFSERVVKNSFGVLTLKLHDMQERQRQEERAENGKQKIYLRTLTTTTLAFVYIC